MLKKETPRQSTGILVAWYKVQMGTNYANLEALLDKLSEDEELIELVKQTRTEYLPQQPVLGAVNVAAMGFDAEGERQ